MTGSVYVVNEVVSTSEKSWEDAARLAIETASKSFKFRLLYITKFIYHETSTGHD
jgi:flavin-binding protein dodecin